jgi:hypothetical protein
MKSNPDGWGLHSAHGVFYSFGLPNDDIRAFLSSKKKQNWMVTIHFRYATHGTISIDNAHPFRLNDTEWLMHNGCLSGDMFDHKTKSDTAILAEVLKDCGPKGRDFILEQLAEEIGYGNRFCILRKNGWTRYGNWHYDRKTLTWHSNRQLLGSPKSNVPKVKTHSDWDWATRQSDPFDYDDEVNVRNPLGF